MNQRTCTIGDCARPLIARGMCARHYQRMRDAGRLHEFKPLPRPREAVGVRFKRTGWDVTPAGCWEWRGSRNVAGYGQISSGTRTATGHPRPALAPRVSWEVHSGPIPDGLAVLHRCDNPPCVNPAHLFLETRGDNNADMARKRRTLNGERRPNAKLTDAQVDEIRERYAAGGISQRALGAEYGVGGPTVSMIVNRKLRWFKTYPVVAGTPHPTRVDSEDATDSPENIRT